MTSQAAEIQFSGEAPEWRDLAACKDQATRDRDPWHPPDSKKAAALYEEARQVCAGCPVRPHCLAYALDLLELTGNVHGMWAGWRSADLRRYAAELGRPTRKAAQHGTRARYVGSKCRCPNCTAANARYEDTRRTQAKPAAAEPDRHRRGGPWSYAS